MCAFVLSGGCATADAWYQHIQSPIVAELGKSWHRSLYLSDCFEMRKLGLENGSLNQLVVGSIPTLGSNLLGNLKLAA
jgi:hypothetical protein